MNTDVVDTNNCHMMISFNDGSTGEDARKLANFLNAKGFAEGFYWLCL